MKEIKIILLVITVIFFTFSCIEGLFKDDDELTLDRIPYTGNQLRIDGYYYLLDTDSTLLATYFFYKNGILLAGGGRPLPEGLDYIEENYFSSKEWIKKIPGKILKWGIFQIEGNKISFEKWYPSSISPTPAYIRYGEILNDTTFTITKSVRPKTGKKRTFFELYHFKEFSPKPDSTNDFIN